jgi:hypothetical protein
VAVWSGWSERPPPALESILGQAAGFQVEVLTPVSSTAKAWEVELRQAHGERLAGLTVRQVDGMDGSAHQRWRAAAGAATGEFLILSDGATRLEGDGALPALAGWAAAPGVGAVTLPVSAEGKTVAGVAFFDDRAGGVAAAQDGEPSGGASFAAAATPLLMAISRRALQRADGFAGAGDGADLDLALRLRRLELFTVVLGAFQARTSAEALSPWLSRPLPLGLKARYGPELALLSSDRVE